MIPQLPVSASFDELLYFIVFVIFCQVLFFKKFVERRKRDLNPRAAVNDLLPFQGSPFGQLGYFSTVARIAFILYYHMIFSCNERRGWDSNPRALADKRFSRPPRYDHFDTSPVQSAKLIISSNFRFVNTFLIFFCFFNFPVNYTFSQRFQRYPDPLVL